MPAPHPNLDIAPLTRADEQLRDGLIQCFELAQEMRRRSLRMTSPTPDEFDQMPFQDLIRTGNAHNLLRGDWPAWRRYRDLRDTLTRRLA